MNLKFYIMKQSYPFNLNNIKQATIALPMAEEGGFEPPVPCGTLVFETSTFDHSDTLPYSSRISKIFGYVNFFNLEGL